MNTNNAITLINSLLTEMSLTVADGLRLVLTLLAVLVTLTYIFIEIKSRIGNSKP